MIGNGTVKENKRNGANQIIDSKNALKKTERRTYNYYCMEFIYLKSSNKNTECKVFLIVIKWNQ